MHAVLTGDELTPATDPMMPGVDAPTELPPCPGLRGQPGRDYVPFANKEFRGG